MGRGTLGNSFDAGFDEFGSIRQFSTPPRQNTPSVAEDTYQGRVLFYWQLMLGLAPPESRWSGLKIAGMGSPANPPKSGNVEGSLFAYIKQIELDLAILRSGLLLIEADVSVIRADVAAIRLSVQSIDSKQDLLIALLTSIDNKTP